MTTTLDRQTLAFSEHFTAIAIDSCGLGRSSPLPTPTTEIADQAIGKESGEAGSRRILNEALRTLSETQRSLVMLKDYEGYSYQEIGVITGLNESQVKVYLHRARLQLRAYIVKPENVI